MEKLFFSLFAIIIFSGTCVAQSTTDAGCQIFRMPIISPPDSPEDRMKIINPKDQFQFKTIVIDPCKKLFTRGNGKPWKHPHEIMITPPHPFIELSRKTPSQKNLVPKMAFSLPSMKADYRNFDLKLELKF